MVIGQQEFESLQRQRDELAAALRNAEIKLRAMSIEFGRSNFTDRYGDGPIMLAIADQARAALAKVSA